MLTLLFSLLLSTSATAAPVPMTDADPIITRTAVDNDHVELTVANLLKERTLINLINLETDEVHFTKRVTDHNGYSVRLSLKEMPEGRYVLCVKNGDTVRRQVIMKTETGILCSAWK